MTAGYRPGSIVRFRFDGINAAGGPVIVSEVLGRGRVAVTYGDGVSLIVPTALLLPAGQP